MSATHTKGVSSEWTAIDKEAKDTKQETATAPPAQRTHVTMAPLTKGALLAARSSGVTIMARHARPKGQKKKSSNFSTWNTNSQGMPQRGMPRVDNKPYKIIQEIYVQNAVATSTTLEVFTGFQFNVNALPQLSTLAALFDQYRIARVEFWLIPNGTASSVTGLYSTAIDYDDSTSLTTYNQILSYQNVVTTQPDTGQYRSFVPHVAVASYSGAFTSFANETAPWIDAASPSVQHYGVKFGSTPTSVVASYSTIYRLHVEWKNVR